MMAAAKIIFELYQFARRIGRHPQPRAWRREEKRLLRDERFPAVGEAMRAAEWLGIGKELVVDACSGGAAGSWQLANLGPYAV
jgi:hypothetical protein